MIEKLKRKYASLQKKFKLASSYSINQADDRSPDIMMAKKKTLKEF
jgi:hypothetical protein